MARLTAKSRRLYRRARRLIPAGVNSPVRYYTPYPLFIESAKGPRFRTVDGVEFLDYCMAYGALVDGHADLHVVRAVQTAVEDGSIYGQPAEIEVELAETISGLVPSMQMVRLVNSGTEATMHSLRLARGFTGKKKILKFEGGFHGSHDSVLTKKGPHGSIVSIPSSAGVPRDTAKNTLVANYNDEKTVSKIIKDHSSELAAVIVEPVAGNMGPVPPAKGFLETLRKLTREEEVVLIFDEVITGFRLSLGGAQQYYGIKPDLTVLGKIVGGGFPLAAFGGRREIMQNLAPLGPVYQAGTYSGNPISTIAGLTTLQSLKKRSNKVYSSLERLGNFLAQGVRDMVESNNIPAHVNQIGSMFQIFFTDRNVTDYTSANSSDKVHYSSYFRSLLESQIFMPPSQLECCFLSTSHTKHDLQRTLEAIENRLKALGR